VVLHGLVARATENALSSRFLEFKRIVHDLERFGRIGFVDDATDLDFAGGDVLDVDFGVGQSLEHALGDAGVDAHADADDADLGQIGLIHCVRFSAQFLADSLGSGLDVGEVAVLDGEADVGGIVVHDVLNDVIDGDTVVVRDSIGRETHVRLIGVDAPEMNYEDERPPDYWAERATKYLEHRAEGKTVIIRLETTQTRDKYDRLLAYLYATDTDNLNLDLVRDGQAYADRRFGHTLRSQFEAAESDARKKGTGLWTNVKTEQMPRWRQDWLKRQSDNRVADFR